MMQKMFKIDITLKKPKENLQILNDSNTDSGNFYHRLLGTMKSLLKTVKTLKIRKKISTFSMILTQVLEIFLNRLVTTCGKLLV